MRQTCKFGEIPPKDLWDILFLAVTGGGSIGEYGRL